MKIGAVSGSTISYFLACVHIMFKHNTACNVVYHLSVGIDPYSR